MTAGLEHDPFQQLREKLIVGLQYIAKIPRQQALLKILYHKCEFNDVNRPGFPGECFICELRLPAHRF
ncbi:MAATS-type transcriptional repressor, C-terminal domain protein [Escherichia coli 97.0246]|uniref:MAATS-type transcriptional repressor, C-terminal domain protein n=1 Tax=Escherichia coli 97.0246 TaxID=869670 RepID=A0A8E0FPP7_ECOLX|nr:MAATS-type transcriptional repressor, C-terminal domain protein [Escherichia coli 97.0246]